MRHSGAEQDKCHKHGFIIPLICWRSLSRKRRESHGFALCAPNGAGTDQKQNCLTLHDYRRNVMLIVPTFPLVSKTLNETACSPAVAIGNSTV
jgi:hypothetical protein